MEEIKNPQSETPKNTARNQYQSVDEQIQKMRLAFANAKLPHIMEQLKNVGYTEEKIDRLISKLSALEALHQAQKKEYAEQYAETERFHQKRKEIHEVYMRHLAFCKILFKGNVEAGRVLEFAGDRKQAYGAWYQQVSNFYAQLLGNTQLKAKVATINIKEQDLEAQKTALAELTKIKESQAKETGEAQKATETRDEALDSLYPQYLELIAYAKILFDGDQTLEQLGITVKR